MSRKFMRGYERLSEMESGPRPIEVRTADGKLAFKFPEEEKFMDNQWCKGVPDDHVSGQTRWVLNPREAVPFATRIIVHPNDPSWRTSCGLMITKDWEVSRDPIAPPAPPIDLKVGEVRVCELRGVKSIRLIEIDSYGVLNLRDLIDDDQRHASIPENFTRIGPPLDLEELMGES